jgi:hypothetical protein
VRVDKYEVYRLVEAIRESLRSEADAPGVEKANAFDVLMVADEVHEAIMHAYPVPLTDQVRLPRQRAAELAIAFRAARRT